MAIPFRSVLRATLIFLLVATVRSFAADAASSGDMQGAFSGASSMRGSLRSVLKPVSDVPLSSRAAGIIEKICVPEGSQVKAGQPIISLDSNQERADVLQAEASVRGAKADMDRATAEFDRIQSVQEDKIYSPKQILEAKAQAEVARSRYEQAAAALELAKVRLANRDIVSPIDGIFFKTTKVVGEAVDRYETVARIVDVTSLEMVVFCDASYFSLFKVDQKVDVKVLRSTENQAVVHGTVSYVDPIVDYSSGTFRVKVKVERSEQAVPGFSAILMPPS
jgi:RND family efflux transporter MFP subunit